MIEQARLFAEEEHKGVRLYVEHDTSVDEWLKENHYLHSTPAGLSFDFASRTKPDA